MKLNIAVLVLLALQHEGQAFKLIQRDSDEDKALAAIGAAIDEETQIEADQSADAGEVSQTEEKKEEPVGPPPPIDESKKDEVESLMEKYDHDEAQEKWLKSDAYKKQLQKKKESEIAKQ